MNAVGSFVLVEPITRNEQISEDIKKRSGIIYEPKHQGSPNMGYVRFIGDGLESPKVKIGDKVIFNEPHPDGFKWDDIGYFALTEKQIVAKYVD